MLLIFLPTVLKAIASINMFITLSSPQTYLKKSLLLLALLSSSLFAQTPVQTIDKVIVIIDDEVILQSEFDERQSQILEQFSEEDLAKIPLEDLNKQILDQLIIENLQMQMSYRVGIRVDDNMLNQALSGIAQQNGMNFDQFRTLLETDGMYLATRQQVAQEIAINQLQNGAVNQRIDITRQEVENYLRSEAGIASIAPEYHVAHILIPNNASVPVRATEELATLLYQQLQDGANILQIAAAEEISGIGVSGGDLGWNKVETLPGIFRDLVPGLESGELAEPFTSPSGLHIVQVLEKRGGAEMELDETRVRHINIIPNEIRTEAQAETLIRELHQRILDGEDFGDIARQNTDDPNSMVAGGDLDWVNQSMLPEDYIAIMDETEIGTLTEPFRVSTGWHILEVLDRRIADVTDENKQYQAQQILRNRKFENELQNWLTEIRDEAYIDIK